MATSLRPYEFLYADVYVSSGALAGASATDTVTATTDHGLAVNDMVTFTDVGAMVGVTANTRYFVVNVGSSTTFKISATYGGSAISAGTATGLDFYAYRKYTIPWPNNSTPNVTTTDYTWEGGGATETMTLLKGIALPIQADAIPVSMHAAVFGKTAITGALPDGGTNGKSYGGGNDQGGVSCMVVLKAYSKKDADGVASTPYFNRWFPKATITLTQPAGLQTGQKAALTGYNVTASKTTTDFLGAAITGVSTGGDFFIDYETTS